VIIFGTGSRRRTGRKPPLLAAARVALGIAVALSIAVPASLATTTVASASTGFVAEQNLDGRDGPSLNANTVVVDKYRAGGTVQVVCQARGEMAYGSTIWDKTTDNLWVTDAYVKTGYTGFDPNVPGCSDTSRDAKDFLAESDLNGRNAPSLSATVVQDNQYRSGDYVPVVCQATGGLAYGSSIWDKTMDGVWVTDAYVKTGYTGFDPNLPKCGDTSAPSTYRYLAETDLNGRDTRSVSAPAVKIYPGGSTISVTCQAIGENAYGSNIWDKTSDGLWVTDHYLKTGYDSFVPGMPRCADDTSGSGGGYPAKTDLDGRKTKSISATAVKTYPSGSTIHITCQAYGEYAYGSYIWDKTADDLWVTDYYVKTGTDGFLSNMPRCDNDPPSGGSGGGGSGGAGTCDTAGHGRISGPAGSTSGTNAEKIQRVIAAARAMTGKGLSYSWGAGGPGGPSCGSAFPSPGGYNDYYVYGFDCSGYTEYAFWAGAGVDIGEDTNHQSYHGRVLSYSDRQAGDLLFWGSQGNTDHVAIYLGGGEMLEAAPPRGTGSVHETAVYGSHSYVVRIFG
jgi:cell wall-associated NlpC family hydrolase